MLGVTELFNIAVNDSDAKKTVRYKRVLLVAELIVFNSLCSFDTLIVLLETKLMCIGMFIGGPPSRIESCILRRRYGHHGSKAGSFGKPG